jgi:hypothetical protein
MKVVELNSSNFRDIPATLRQIADDIEAGKCGEVRSVALVRDNGEEINVHGLGECSAAEAYMLLGVGMRELEKAYQS